MHGRVKDVNGHNGGNLVPGKIQVSRFVEGVVGSRFTFCRRAKNGHKIAHTVDELGHIDRACHADPKMMHRCCTHNDG
ncbi:hypothetical protein SDC9_93954 [bioreactor metagenome]|uniref:Uncharacterized protein n=1 Tax=bioreactor metagenome TaxID=1076179 RepID=A0A645A2V3_9ZZZZ